MSGPLRHPQAFGDADAVNAPAALRHEIGAQVRVIREMLDSGTLPAPVVRPDPAPASPAEIDAEAPAAPARPGLLRAWGGWMAQRMRPPEPPAPPPPAPPPAPIVLQLPAEAPQTAPVVLAVLEDPELDAQIRERVREELEGEMGERFTANLRQLVRREVALAEERGLLLG